MFGEEVRKNGVAPYQHESRAHSLSESGEQSNSEVERRGGDEVEKSEGDGG